LLQQNEVPVRKCTITAWTWGMSLTGSISCLARLHRSWGALTCCSPSSSYHQAAAFRGAQSSQALHKQPHTLSWQVFVPGLWSSPSSPTSVKCTSVCADHGQDEWRERRLHKRQRHDDHVRGQGKGHGAFEAAGARQGVLPAGQPRPLWGVYAQHGGLGCWGVRAPSSAAATIDRMTCWFQTGCLGDSIGDATEIPDGQAWRLWDGCAQLGSFGYAAEECSQRFHLACLQSQAHSFPCPVGLHACKRVPARLMHQKDTPRAAQCMSSIEWGGLEVKTSHNECGNTGPVRILDLCACPAWVRSWRPSMWDPCTRSE